LEGPIELGRRPNSGLPGYVWSSANWLIELEMLEQREPPPRTFQNLAWWPVAAKFVEVTVVHCGTVRFPCLTGNWNGAVLRSAHKRIVAQAGADAARGYVEVYEDVRDRDRTILSPLQVDPVCERVADPHGRF
jgi:hypothetical protein